MAIGVEPRVTPDLQARERIELILAQLDRLPTLPSILVRLLAVTTSDGSSARDVVDIIKLDPSLTAGILRLVRRADLGVRDEGMSVARAVTLLGFRAVRNAVLSSRFFEVMSSPNDVRAAAVTRKELWRHSLAVACAAEMIAERVAGLEAAGDAFVCGLLHDIGKIALDVCLPKSYARVVERLYRRPTCICDVEQEVFGLDHTIAGKRLATRWNLPQSVVDCVWLHHQEPDALPSSIAHPQLVRIVHAADNLVRRQRIGFSGYRQTAEVHALASGLRVPDSALHTVMERLADRMEPLREMLGLEESADPEQYLESVVKANRKLSELNSGLTDSNRRLSLRSACFDALDRFTQLLQSQQSVGEVCASAAAAMVGLVQAEGVVVYVGLFDGGFLHVGHANGSAHGSHWPNPVGRPLTGKVTPPAGSADTESLDARATEEDRCDAPVAAMAALIEVCESWRAVLEPQTPEPGVPEGGIRPAPAGFDMLWERCVGSPATRGLWLLPIDIGIPRGRAGVLLSADERMIRTFKNARQECAALARAFGCAASSAWVRVDNERLGEEFASSNRRFRATEPDRLRTRSIDMIARMAAGAAHEINNPLAVISGRAQLEIAASTEPDRRRALEVIVEQTQRASGIVRDMMRFAKPEAPNPSEQSLAGVVDGVSQHCRQVLGSAADRLRPSVADPGLTVYADAAHLLELLTAAVTNAIEATDPQTGCVQINSPSRASDETVRIVVRDNGVGMSPEVLEHALDPFFSSRPAGRGRGMGLSRAHRLAEINGGQLWLESTPQVGTTVTIELPSRPPAS